MSENTGHKPAGIFVPVIGVLGIVGILMYMAYDWVSGMGRGLHAPSGPAAEEVIRERIRPVGQVAIAGQDDDVQDPAATPGADTETAAADDEAAADEAEEMDGEAVYQAACTACHGPGIAGAPQTGDAAAWEARLEQGMDTLVQHAIEGFQGDAGVMPPRGGNANLTDEQVRDAVQYMVDTLED